MGREATDGRIEESSANAPLKKPHVPPLSGFAGGKPDRDDARPTWHLALPLGPWLPLLQCSECAPGAHQPLSHVRNLDDSKDTGAPFLVPRIKMPSQMTQQHLMLRLCVKPSLYRKYSTVQYNQGM